MGNVSVLVRTVDGLGNPIQGTLVQVYNDSGAFLTQGITNAAAGEVEFTLTGDVAGIPYHFLLAKNEWSFPPTNRKDVVVTDPPSPSNEFEFAGSYGTSLYPVVLQVHDDTVLQEPVDGVTIRVFDENDAYITTVTTVDGEAGLSLPGAPDPGREFIIRLNKTGVTFEHSTQKIQVLEDNGSPFGDGGYGDGGYGGSGAYPVNTFEFDCHVRTLPESPNLNMCRLSGTLRDASLKPIKNAQIEFSMISVWPDMQVSGLHFINDPTVVDGHIIAKPVKVKSDVNGYVEIDLIRGAEYEAFIHGWQHPDGISESIIVPDSPAARVEDVLFPYVSRVDFDQTAIPLPVGQSTEVGVVATGSNLQDISLYGDLIGLLDFTPSDPAVISILPGVNKTFLIGGLAAGTATINVVRKDYTSAPRLPAVPDLLVSPLVITVS